MGKTLVIYKINAKDMEKIGEVLEVIKGVKNGEYRDARKEPIGFGVEIIKAAFTVPEKDDNAIDTLTEELNSLELIEDAEVTEMTLL